MEPQPTPASRAGMGADPAPPRRILHVDCDAFFVQVARLEDPEGAGRASKLIVGGTPSGRGVVTSASYDVRPFGVRSGMPTGKALRLCPDATVVPVPRSACSARSREVRAALERLCPVVQAASIDEFYLDLTGTERLFEGESLADTARRIRETVLEETSISVSIGGGTRKLIAKMATNEAKPAGVHIVAPGDELAFMRRFRLGQIPGIGPALTQALARRGLERVEDALEVDPVWLERWFGEARGRWISARIRGQDRSRVDPGEPRKSISAERTFFEDVADDEDLERRMLKVCGTVGRVLRKQDLRARTITAKLRDADFTTRQASRTLDEPVESDPAIYRVARALLAELRDRRRTPARLLGVALSNLEDRDGAVRQLALMDLEAGPETDRDRGISRTLDALNERFGDGTLLPARALRRPKG